MKGNKLKMAKEKTSSKQTNFSEWYLNIIQKAELADYPPVKGCMVIRPNGYAIWENVRHFLDKMFKQTGHKNAYFPLLIPQSFIQKEKQHVEGFSPEVAVVTHAGGKKLEEPYVIRPTSETIINSMFSKWVQSYRDLPLLINQWANVIRWEMRTRPFLRTSEFLWQEGHTCHETKEEAEEEAHKMLGVYKDFLENYLAIPILCGKKTENERFAGAVDTYCVEALMQDGKALQAGTSHYLGQNFSKAFDIKFQTREGILDHVHQTSWGVSTRLIGAIIMVHSDDDGLVLPPRIAPTHVVIVPITPDKDSRTKVLQEAEMLADSIESYPTKQAKLERAASVIIDKDDQRSPGWKFNHWEAQGVPIRVEIGPRDIEKEQAVLVRRDTKKKTIVPIKQAPQMVMELLDDMQKSLFEKAYNFVKKNTTEVNDYEEFKSILDNKGGYISAHWDGTHETELAIKEETKATIRCIPFNQELKEGKCIKTGNPSKGRVIFARAY